MPSPLKKIESLLTKLVEIPSVSSSTGECGRVANLVEKLFLNLPWKLQCFEHNGVHSIYISKGATLSSDLLFLGHLDVVPGPEAIFTPRIEGEWLFGRGSADMKGSVAVMIQLFLDHANDPAWNKHALLLTTDEELGGFNGVGHLVKDLGLKAKCVFNPDGGEAFVPCVGEKGILLFRLEAKGTSAHGSMPWEGNNAIDLLWQDITALRSSYKYAQADDTWQISFNLGKIQGGKAANSVPDSAYAEIDVRFPGPLSSAEILTKFKSCLKHSDLKVLIEALPVSVDAQDPNLKMLVSALKQKGFSGETMREHGGSDARWFVEQGASILLMLPEGTAFHIDEEAVHLPSLAKFYEVLELFVQLRSSNKS